MESHEESLQKLQEAKQYVILNQFKLKMRYNNRYIAVREGLVLGYGDDNFKLAKELEKTHRNKAILIGTIDDIVNPKEVEIPSPELDN